MFMCSSFSSSATPLQSIPPSVKTSARTRSPTPPPPSHHTPDPESTDSAELRMPHLMETSGNEESGKNSPTRKSTPVSRKSTPVSRKNTPDVIPDLVDTGRRSVDRQAKYSKDTNKDSGIGENNYEREALNRYVKIVMSYINSKLEN